MSTPPGDAACSLGARAKAWYLLIHGKASLSLFLSLSKTRRATFHTRLWCAARLIVHPLDVVKKRFQVAGLNRSLRYGERVAAQAGGFMGVVRTIVAREGPRGFYKGLLPGLIKSAPASAGPHGYQYSI